MSVSTGEWVLVTGVSSGVGVATLQAAQVLGAKVIGTSGSQDKLDRLKTLGLIDKIVPEPLGGAHRDPQAAAQALKRALAEALKQVQEKKPKELVEARLERLMGYGKFKEAQER